MTLLLCLVFSRKLAGLTGDTYGAVIVSGEAAALLLIIALPRWGW